MGEFVQAIQTFLTDKANLGSPTKKDRKDKPHQPKSKPAIEKSSKPAHAPKPKETKEIPSKASTAKPPKPKTTKEKSTKTTQPLKASKGAASEKTNSEGDTEILQFDEEQGKDVDDQVVMDKDQAGSDPGKNHGALAGPDHEPTHDEFMVDLYPKVQESLKFPADEHVILEEPLSSSGTLSLMKNMDDA
nr:hypothetical protein [Tanacetum cinerariifolium]